MIVGYLTSQYPAPSHTFIRREIAAVRAAGVDVRTYSIRAGRDAQGGADPETFTVLDQSAFAILGATLAALVGAPGRFVATLRLALRHRVPGLKALAWTLFHFAEAMLLARVLRRDGVTRLHNHFANPAATVGLLAATYLRLPWSLTLHGVSEFDYPAGLLLAAKLERAEFAACASHFVMAQAMRLTRPAIWPRLHLVRCGLDLAALPAAPAPRDQPARALICVGRLSPEKGHAGLLAAFADLVRDDPALTLTLVGDGPERAAVEAQIAALRLGEHVRLLGSLDETATLGAIARADLLVLTSFMEGLPIVLMEALALGVPVVASRVAGIPELVEDGVTGLLFAPGDWAGLRRALARAVRDPELRRGAGDAGRARVLAEFSYPGAADPLLTLFGVGASRSVR